MLGTCTSLDSSIEIANRCQNLALEYRNQTFLLLGVGFCFIGGRGCFGLGFFDAVLKRSKPLLKHVGLFYSLHMPCVPVISYAAHRLHRLIEEEDLLLCSHFTTRSVHDDSFVLLEYLNIKVLGLPLFSLCCWKICDRRDFDSAEFTAEGVDDLEQCLLFVSASVCAAKMRDLIFGQVLFVRRQLFRESAVGVHCRAKFREGRGFL